MASITPPTGFSIRAANGGYEYAQGVATDPYTLKTLVHDFGGKRKRITIQVPPITEAAASAWTEFFEDLNGMVNTFNLDVDKGLQTIFPHITDTSVAFRLAEPNIRWDIDTAKFFGFSFDAIEVI